MWLRGSSDVAHLRQDIYDLLTGAIVAGQRGSGQGGNGAQLTTDKWDALDATNFVIRSPTTQKPFWKDDASNYRILWRGAPRFTLRNGIGAAESVVIGKPTFSGAYAGGPTRCWFAVYVSTVNSVAGTLAGTVVTYQVINADTGATDTGSTTVSGWSGASDTKVLKYGISLTLTLNGGEQFTANHISWARGYSTTYPQGVDYFPEGAKIKTGSVVLSSSSGGTNNYTENTDYKLVQQADRYPFVYEIGNDGNGNAYIDWGGPGLFSGIEWQAGGAPPTAGTNYYLVDCDIYQGYLQLNWVGGQFWPIAWDFWDPVAQKGRHPSKGSNYDSVTVTAFDNNYYGNNTPGHQIFTNTNPTSTWFINFWLSVKPDKIIFVIRGDPANTGVINISSFQKATQILSKDKSTWVLLTVNSTYIACCPHVPGPYVYDKPYWGIQTLTNRGNLTGLYTGNYGTGNTSSLVASGPTQSYINGANPCAWNDKWEGEPYYVWSQIGNYDTAGNYNNLTRAPGGRRTRVRGIWAFFGDNWASLDELVDGGNTYLLVLADGNFGGLFRYNAILEE